MSTPLAAPPQHLIEDAVARALAEDLGLAGDITTNSVVPAKATSRAAIVARKPGVVAGLAVAEAAFRQLDPALRFEPSAHDGEKIAAGRAAATISGSARAILTAERVALNYLSHLSGIATLTRRYVDAAQGSKARIVDTRKTTPGLRVFEKYAVRCGGGMSHRVGLFDAILIKDNHLIAGGPIGHAIDAARAGAGHLVKVEVEVDTLAQLEEALAHAPDVVLLDNMSPAELKQAVALIGGRALAEASGGVTLDTVAAIAATGVDLISVGALTHSAPILDFGLDFQP